MSHEVTKLTDIPDLDSDTFRVRFFRLSTLNILSNLLVPLASLIDVAFLGHLDEIRHLNGVALAAVIFDLIYRLGLTLRMGTTGTTAQASGRQDEDEVALILLRNLLLALVFSGVILLLQWPIRELGFNLLASTAETEAAGRAYFNVMILGVPANMTMFVLLGWLLGLEQSGKVLLISIVSNGANIFLDYWLIVRCHWGSTGAGLATVGSQYAALVIALGFAARLLPWHSIKGLLPRIHNWSATVETLILNRDILLKTLVIGLTMSVFIDIGSSLGTTIFAANTLLFQAVILFSHISRGFCYATESLTGVFYGEGRSDKLQQLLQLAMVSCMAAGVLCATVTIGFSDVLFQFFTNKESVLSLMHIYVFWLLPVMTFGSIANTLDGYFLGLAVGSILRDAMVLAAICGFSLLAMAAWQWHSCHILWLAWTSFMMFRALFLGLQVSKAEKLSQAC